MLLKDSCELRSVQPISESVRYVRLCQAMSGMLGFFLERKRASPALPRRSQIFGSDGFTSTRPSSVPRAQLRVGRSDGRGQSDCSDCSVTAGSSGSRLRCKQAADNLRVPVYLNTSRGLLARDSAILASLSLQRSCACNGAACSLLEPRLLPFGAKSVTPFGP